MIVFPLYMPVCQIGRCRFDDPQHIGLVRGRSPTDLVSHWHRARRHGPRHAPTATGVFEENLRRVSLADLLAC